MFHARCFCVKLQENADTWQMDKTFREGGPWYDLRSMSGLS
jgi:hypothetical protein